MPEFYVYAYIDPRDGTPFYIGKGKGNRDQQHLFPSKMKQRQFLYNKLRKLIAQGICPEVRRICENLSEEEALHYESFFIHALGRRNLGTGCLCNLTNGGDGPFGVVVSEETRRKLSRVWKGRTREPFSESHRRKLSQARAGVSRGPHSEKTRRKISRAHKGKTLSEEHRRKLSKAKETVSAGTRRKISQAHAGRHLSEEHKRKIGDAHKGRKRPKSTGARISFTKWKKSWGGIQPLVAREAVAPLYSEVCCA